MMESKRNSIVVKFLSFVAGIFISLTLLGCNDPVVADMAAEHRQLGSVCQQELRQGLAGMPPTTQAPAFRPAP